MATKKIISTNKVVTKEKITANFHFKKKYNNGKNIATVVLNINYPQKDFSIVPLSGSNDKFYFKNSSIETAKETIEKWKAIALCIEEASEFVMKEIDLIF